MQNENEIKSLLHNIRQKQTRVQSEVQDLLRLYQQLREAQPLQYGSRKMAEELHAISGDFAAFERALPEQGDPLYEATEKLQVYRDLFAQSCAVMSRLAKGYAGVLREHQQLLEEQDRDWKRGAARLERMASVLGGRTLERLARMERQITRSVYIAELEEREREQQLERQLQKEARVLDQMLELMDG